MTRLLALSLLAAAVWAQVPNPDEFYHLGPDSLRQDGVPKGEIRGPFTLSSQVYWARSIRSGFTFRSSTIRRFRPAS